MDTTILSCQFAFNPLSLLRFIVKNVLLWNPSCSWGPKLADCQRFANSWGRYFTGNWLIALKCRTIHYFVKSSRGVNSWLRLSTSIEPPTMMIPQYTQEYNPIPRQRGPMQIVGSGTPMERIAIDILCELPETDRDNRHIYL